MASPLSREIFIGDKYSPKPDFGRNAFVAAVPCAWREGMAKRDDAALKLLRWELQGHGKVVMEAMLRHPDKSLAEAVDLIEQEVPSLAASDRTTNDSPGEMPAPVAPSRPRTPPELDALSQEFQTFRHLLHPKEAKEVEATLKDVVQVLVKTVEAIEENKAAATKTFGNEKLAGKYAEALLKLLQKTSL